MKIENNKEDWETLFNELYDLNQEFIIKRNNHRNDFRHNTEFIANEKRKTEIINKSVTLIRHNTELTDFLFANENNDFMSEKDRNDYINHMESRGFWVESIYASYMFKIIRYLEKKLD